MRWKTWTFALGFILGMALPMASPSEMIAQERPRVAVLSFENRTDWWGRQLGASAASQLTVALVNSGAFSVLERQQVEQVFDELYMGQSGAVTPEQAIALGKLLGAEYLITGELTGFNVSQRGGGLSLGRIQVGANETRAESAMSVRVIRVETGEIVAATQAQGDEVLGRGLVTDVIQTSSSTEYNPTIADQALGPAIQSILADLIAARGNMPTSGAVAAAPAEVTGVAQDGSIYIDDGADGGVQEGTRFHVVRVVDVIRDRDGNVLDEITDRVGVLLVTRVLSQSSVATIVEGTAEIGDRVEREPNP
jgi:curli biogenesis system outer membrane secretion channel CsgG